MTQATTWQTRIVGEGTEAPDQLLANPKNWRIHPSHQQEGLEAVLDKVGWVQRVVVNRRTGNLVDGHLRVTLAMRRNEPLVPVVYVDLDPTEEDLVLATLDPIAALASTDQDGLRLLLEDLSAGDPGSEVQKLLDMIGQDAGLNVVPPPSLDELAGQHGEHDEETFWPVIKVKVSPEVHETYQATLARMTGGTEAEKFAAMLERVQ